jgi:phosphoribosyl 1,2-cyclic phosphodiesterase
MVAGMMELTILGSGSTGNAVVVSTPGTRVLVDAGFSARSLGARLAAVGLAPESLDAVLLSHEHGDHTQGLETFCRRFGTPVFCTRHTQRVLADAMRHQPAWRLFEAGMTFQLGGLEVTGFPVPHDAVDPLGFVFSCGGLRLGVATDLGHVNAAVADALAGVQALVLEANYDQELLERDTKRPWPVKQRIASRHGHLSNQQAAEFAAQLLPRGLARLVLAHLSRDCNSPERAVATVAAGLAGGSCQVLCATQDEPLGPLALGQ